MGAEIKIHGRSSMAKRTEQAEVKTHGRVASRNNVKKHDVEGAEKELQLDDLHSIVQALGPAAALGNMRLLDLKGVCKSLGLEPADTKPKIIKQVGAHFSSSATLTTPRTRGPGVSPESSARQEATGNKHVRASPRPQAELPQGEPEEEPEERPQAETALSAWRKAVAVMTPEDALAAWRKAVVQEDVKAGQKVRVKNSVSTDAAYLNGQVGQV